MVLQMSLPKKLCVDQKKHFLRKKTELQSYINSEFGTMALQHICIKICQGPDYEEFVNAAKSDNETQFVEVSKVELARVLYPDIKPTDRFLGIVKSEPERYTAYGEFGFYANVQFILVFLH